MMMTGKWQLCFQDNWELITKEVPGNNKMNHISSSIRPSQNKSAAWSLFPAAKSYLFKLRAYLLRCWYLIRVTLEIYSYCSRCPDVHRKNFIRYFA